MAYNTRNLISIANNMLFMIFFFKKIMVNNEQIEEYEISFYTFFSKNKTTKKLERTTQKGKDNVGLVVPFRRETISVFNHATFTTFVNTI